MEDSNLQDSNSDSDTLKAPQLTAIELRVLGTIMEKQLTTPNGYPLTVNSIVTACNQKSSREPISNYQQGEVKRTLLQLEDNKFVTQEYGSRAEKYSQRFIKALELGKKQQALLCVMMLRGPQTISELDTRTQRMCDFTNREDLEHCIDRLCDRDIPYAIRLGQQAGQRGERIGHLFCGTPTVALPIDPAIPAQTAAQSDNVELLEMEVADLHKIISALQTETNELKRQLHTLYALTGNQLNTSNAESS